MLVVKNLPANAGDARNESLIPESGRLEMATHSSILAWKIPALWWAIVHGVTQTQLTMHTTRFLLSFLQNEGFIKGEQA